MARLRCGVTTEGGISIAASVTKTLLQLAAPTNQRFALQNAYISFDGVTASDKHHEVQMLRQTDAGTGGVAATEFSLRDDPETPQVTALKGPWATTEPAAGQIVKRWFIHPQAAYERIYLPGVDEIEAKGGGRLAMRIVSPAGVATVNALAGMEWEE